VLYTSGSTGRPKGAVLSHAAVLSALASWAAPVMALRPDDVVLAALPLSHSYGLNGALLAPLLAGAAVRVVERFTTEGVAAILAGGGVTVFPGVATMFRRLLDGDGLRVAPSVRLAVSGAAPCPWDLASEWRACTGVRILRGYGMTELFRPISYLAADPTDRADAIGRAVPGVDVRVVDETETPVAPGEIGELVIRSPAAMDGYLNAPAETRAVLREGWFHTGDLACASADGWISITGRKRERILRGGYSVFPAEVEAVLLAHPAVAEAAVIGTPDVDLGEEVTAFVALRSAPATTPDELIDHCRGRLAAFKYPRRVIVVPALPRSATGKILKTRLAIGPARPGTP
jgi:long-chain acyl-CoA synthetase